MESWCGQVLVNALGELVGGTVVAIVFGVVVTYVVGLRQWARQQDAEREERIRRALTYLRLIRNEIRAMVKALPDYRNALKSQKWGTDVPLVVPVWDVVKQSGELTTLVKPELLTRTAQFYGAIGYASRLLDFLIMGWYTDERGVPDLEGKQEQCRDAVEDYLRQAEDLAEKVVPQYTEEIRRLEERVA